MRIPFINKTIVLSKTSIIVISVISVIIIGLVVFLSYYFTVGLGGNPSIMVSNNARVSLPTNTEPVNTPEMLVFSTLKGYLFMDTNKNNNYPPVYTDLQTFLANSKKPYIYFLRNLKLEYYTPVKGSTSVEIYVWSYNSRDELGSIDFYGGSINFPSQKTVTIDTSRIININGIDMYKAIANFPNIHYINPKYVMLQIMVTNYSYPKNENIDINTLIKSSYANSILTITSQDYRTTAPIYTYRINTSYIEAPNNNAETGWNTEFTKYTSAQNQVFILADMMFANEVKSS
jgi:hypothetical protein